MVSNNGARRRTLFLLLLIAAVFIPVFSSGYAEEIVNADYSDSLELFCRAIADINYVSEQESSQRTTKSVRYIVMCKTNGTDVAFEKTEPLQITKGPENRFILVYSNDTKAEEAVQWLQQQTGILYAERDSVVEACSTEEATTTEFYSEGAKLINLGGYLQLARSYGSGSQTVAVIDSGVSTHNRLRSRMKTYGFDYIDVDADPTNDLSGHGTHVAGIIADCTEGTQVWIYPVRVLNRAGSGQMSNVVAAVLEATDIGVDVINLSLESSEMSSALDDAITGAVKKGIAVVVAAGNSSCDTSTVCPAHLTGEGIIVVGSVEASEGSYQRADYSNFGNSIDLYCFGSNINSCSRSGGYVVQSGTSMAAAHVSGICALMGLTHPGISPQVIEHRLESICTEPALPVPDMTGFVPVSEGFCLQNLTLDAGDVLYLPVQAVPSTSHADISWQSTNQDILAANQDGCLQAISAGTTELTAHCLGFDEVRITVNVLDATCSSISLPPAMTVISDEAFMNSGGKHIILPDGVEEIGSRAFANCGNLQTINIPASVNEVKDDLLANSEQAVILCGSGSMIEAYAFEHKLQYIASGN